MAGTPVVDQEDAPQPAMVTPESFEFRDVVFGIVGRQAGRLHIARVDDQEGQDVDSAVADVFELLLLDRAGDRPADRVALQNLLVGHLVGADDPDPSPGQPLGVGVAPEHLLGPIFELGVEPGRPPVAGPMWLEIDLVENPSDGAGRDGRDDPVEHRLACQVFTGPMGDVQPFGDGFQAGELDNLGPLEGGKSGRDVPTGGAEPAVLSTRIARSDGTSSRRWPHRTASGRRWCWSSHLGRWPGRSEHAGPGTRARNRSERPAGESPGHLGRGKAIGVVVHASGHLNTLGRVRSQHNRWHRTPCITYVRRH